MKLAYNRVSNFSNVIRTKRIPRNALNYNVPSEPVGIIQQMKEQSIMNWQFNTIQNAPVLVDVYSYTDFIKDIKKNNIEGVSISQDAKTVKSISKDGVVNIVNIPSNTDIIPLMIEHNIDVHVVSENRQEWQYLGDILPQIIFLSFIAWSVMSRNGIMRMNEFKNEPIIDNNITFADVAGADIAKAELMEIVDFLKDGTKYSKVGASVPKGVLLSGNPGVGKTLLAKAVAGEAEVPFISCSASEFIESFVGVGASRLRDLFKKARAVAPSIIFIDEIDTIGKKRDNGTYGPSNDERDQTINQLLTLMDGFIENEGVIVIAATNRPDILDAALLRPGRFDRRININLPDRDGREAILRVHTLIKPLDMSVDLYQLSKITVGFSGADLANLCNEAAIYAARANMSTVSQANFESALDKITIGEERNIIIPDSKKKIISYHESGHALVALLLSEADIVRKVSIVPRGAAGGVTYFEPLDDNIDFGLVSREYLETKIMIALGGRAAEEIVFGKNKLTTGASGDLIEVQNIARNMITLYGFNERIGTVNWEQMGMNSDISINQEVTILVNRLYKDTLDILQLNIVTLHKLSTILLEKETVTRDELLKIADHIVL